MDRARRFRRFLVACGFAASNGAPTVHAQAPGRYAAEPGVPASPTLTLDQALELALRNSPAVQIQRENVLGTKAAVRAAARDLLVPQLAATTGLGYTAPGARRAGSVLLAEQPAVYSSSYSVSANYTLSAMRLLQPGVARADRRAALGRSAAAEADLRREVTQQYLAVLEAGQVLTQSEGEVARTSEYVNLARVREALGATSMLEVKRAEVQLAQAEVKRVRARNQLTTERLMLGQAVGVRLPAGISLTTQFDLFAPPWQPDSLVGVALRANPALQAADAAMAASGTRARSTRALYQPTLSVGVGMTGWAQRTSTIHAAVRQQLPSGGDSATMAQTRERVVSQFRGFPFNYARQPVGTSVSLNFPLLAGGSRTLQREQALVAEANAVQQRRSEELRVRTEVETGLLALRTAFETAKMQRVVREKAAEELRLARDRARFGAAAGTVVTDASAQLSQAEVDEIDAVHAFYRQLATLEALVGVRLSPPTP